MSLSFPLLGIVLRVCHPLTSNVKCYFNRHLYSLLVVELTLIYYLLINPVMPMNDLSYVLTIEQCTR